ncbi:MAG: BT4734/BF3469 family protein, partial [Chitinophagaceae bacterium]
MLQVSFFKPPISNIYRKIDTPLLAVLTYVKRGHSSIWFGDLQQITNEYRSIKDKKKKSDFKENNFPGFTPSGIFRCRKDDDLIEHSEVVHVDVDDLDKEQFIKVQQSLKDIEPLIIASFTSPSKNGYKIFFRSNKDFTQRQNYEAGVKLLMEKLQLPKEKFDFSCSNLSRLCFMPYDPDCFISPILKQTGIIENIEQLNTGDLIKMPIVKPTGEPTVNNEVNQTAFDNPYLNGGKLDFKHKDDRQNGGKLYNL